MGLYRKVMKFWQRGSRGWSEEDTWNLDTYIAEVLGGSLQYLSENNHGAPGGYPTENPENDTDFDQWDADLRRWATAFREYAEPVDAYLPYSEYWKEQERRTENMYKALKEMTPWFGALWD